MVGRVLLRASRVSNQGGLVFFGWLGIDLPEPLLVAGSYPLHISECISDESSCGLRLGMGFGGVDVGGGDRQRAFAESFDYLRRRLGLAGSILRN